MALEQIKLSKREQWAQSLKRELEGMIPLAEFWACLFDKIEHNSLSPLYAANEILNDLLISAQPIPGWKIAVHAAQKKLFCPEDQQDYSAARRTAQRWYRDAEKFQEAEAQMMILFFNRELLRD